MYCIMPLYTVPYFSSLNDSSYHHDGVNVRFPNHTPEIRNGVIDRAYESEKIMAKTSKFNFYF